MMDKLADATRKPLAQIERFVTTPLVMAATLVIAVLSLTLVIQSRGQVAREANERSKLAEQQLEFQRVTFCGVFEPVAAAGKAPPPPGQPPRTPLGLAIVDGASIATENLRCTPDPNDHQ